jgi:hypothetical protein
VRVHGCGAAARAALLAPEHAPVVLGTLVRGTSRPRLPWLALLLAAQPFRAWVLLRALIADLNAA